MTIGTKQVEVMKNLALKFVSAATVLTVRDNPVIADTSGGAFALTLPSIDKATDVGIPLTILLRTAGNALTINEAADCEREHSLAATMDAAGDSVTLIPRRTFWDVFSNIA